MQNGMPEAAQHRSFIQKDKSLLRNNQNTFVRPPA